MHLFNRFHVFYHYWGRKVQQSVFKSTTELSIFVRSQRWCQISNLQCTINEKLINLQRLDGGNGWVNITGRGLEVIQHRKVTLKRRLGAGADSRVLGDSGNGNSGRGGLWGRGWWLSLSLRGEAEVRGRKSVYRSLNKVAKLVVILCEALGGRGWRLNGWLTGGTEGGGGGGGRREKGGGADWPLKVTKLVIILGQSRGERVRSGGWVWWRWVCKNGEIMITQHTKMEN